MTGRGTPYGLAAAPVIKVSSRSELKAQWPDLIDVDAGPVAAGGSTVEETGRLIFGEILAVASGKKKPGADHLNADGFAAFRNRQKRRAGLFLSCSPFPASQ